MKITVNDCYELEGDYQNQFLGIEVFPKPKYKKLKGAERSVNKVHYDDVYILEPQHYYYVTFNEEIDERESFIRPNLYLFQNGLLFSFSSEENKMYLFNASQNIIYLQKGVSIGEAIFYG
jgi:hypothetical protein